MKTIRIIKVPASDDFPRSVIRNFPRLPQLYLELIENKAKVKRSCIGREFVPTTPPKPTETPVGQSSIANTPQRGREDQREERGGEGRGERREEKRTVIVSQIKSSERPNASDSRNKLYDDYYNLFNDSRYKSPDKREPLPTITESKKEQIDAKKQSVIKSIQREGLDRRERGERESQDNRREGERKKPPPSLKEIEQQKRKLLEAEEEESEEDKKREIMWKIDLLRKQYPLKSIPDITIRMDYKAMKKTYDILFKQLSVDSSTETYKNYLVGGFMVCEMVFGRIGFDMEGFTQQQLLSMNSYEKLLVELGEKTYTPAGMERWPVEVRLALAIFFNAVWFVAARIIQKKSKIDILALHNTIRGLGESSMRRSAPTDRSPGALNFIGKREKSEEPKLSASGTRMMKGPSLSEDVDEGFSSRERRSSS